MSLQCQLLFQIRHHFWLYKKKIKNTTKNNTLVVLTTGVVSYIVTGMHRPGLQKYCTKCNLQIHMHSSNHQRTPYKTTYKEVYNEKNQKKA
jgi:hypothetical protein